MLSAPLERLEAVAVPGTTKRCMNNRSLTIRLDEELEQGLEAACAETGRSRGEIVRDALRRQLQLRRYSLHEKPAATSSSGAKLCPSGRRPAGSRMMTCLRLSRKTTCALSSTPTCW